VVAADLDEHLQCREVPAGLGGSRAGGRLRQQPREHRVARVLGDPHAAQERQPAEVEVAGAPPEHRRVERHRDRLAPARLGAAREALHELLARAPVELEPARRVAEDLGDLLHRHRGLVRVDHRHAEVAHGARHRPLGLAMGHLENADGSDQERRRERPPQHLDARVALRHVAQHARDDPPPVEGGPVGAHGRARPGAAGDVRERLGRHGLARSLLELRGVGGHPRPIAAHAPGVDGCLLLEAAHGTGFYRRL